MMFAPSTVYVSHNGKRIGQGHALDSHEIEDVARRIMEAAGWTTCDYVALFDDGQTQRGELKP